MTATLKERFSQLELAMSRNLVMYALLAIMCVFLGFVSVVALSFYTRAQPTIVVVEILVMDTEIHAGGQVHLEMHTQVQRTPYVGLLIANWREVGTNIHVIPSGTFGRIITDLDDRTTFSLPVPCRVSPGRWIMELATLDGEVVLDTPAIQVTGVDSTCQ
jgi:hypothetical protein